MEDYEGQMPCLVDSKEAYTESANIVDYIEYFYPEPALSIKDSDAVAKVGAERQEGEAGRAEGGRISVVYVTDP